MVSCALISVSENLRFHLTNGRISYAFRVSPEGILEHLHFGGAIADFERAASVPRRVFRGCTLEYEGVLNYNLDDIPQEYPVFGRSDSRIPAFHARNYDGNTTFSLSYHSYELSDSKPSLGALPSSRTDTESGRSQTLTVWLNDAVYGLTIGLHYTIYQHHDVVTRSVEVRNEGEHAIELLSVQSTNLDLLAGDYEVLHFRGSWCREFHLERHPVPPGRFVIESNRGNSSNVHSPSLILAEASASEWSGRTQSVALMYSGNHSMQIERGEFDSIRVSAGINPFNFAWNLAPGDVFYSPEAIHVTAANGFDAMSQIWHRFINSQISPQTHAHHNRATYLNSWEACYFDVNAKAVARLARKAVSLGVEMLVLDDGWFDGRHDDTSSLGDWQADSEKFPEGIEAAGREVKSLGLKFGLWFEPEMVNRESALFRAHPDWVLQVPHRTLSTGRQQFVLDLSNVSVQEYLFARIEAILASGQVDYVKWDMNRSMTEVGSAALPACQQSEVSHRYMLGLYRLLARITQAFPNVLFENCASGGNRADLAMLSYMSQAWISDMSEPIGRLPIINGASYFLPPAIMAAYIGPVPSHQNARAVSLRTRAHAGFFCAARGLSLNEEDLDADHEELLNYIELYKSTANDVLTGTLHRLKMSSNETVWQLTSKDQHRVYVGYFHILSATNLPLRSIRLIGLPSNTQYQLSIPEQPGFSRVISADELMQRGLDLPYVDAMQHQAGHVDYSYYMPPGDFSSVLLCLREID